MAKYVRKRLQFTHRHDVRKHVVVVMASRVGLEVLAAAYDVVDVCAAAVVAACGFPPSRDVVVTPWEFPPPRSLHICLARRIFRFVLCGMLLSTRIRLSTSVTVCDESIVGAQRYVHCKCSRAMMAHVSFTTTILTLLSTRDCLVKWIVFPLATKTIDYRPPSD